MFCFLLFLYYVELNPLLISSTHLLFFLICILVLISSFSSFGSWDTVANCFRLSCSGNIIVLPPKRRRTWPSIEFDHFCSPAFMVQWKVLYFKA